MKNISNVYFFLCFFCSINSFFCDPFECPVKGKVGELKVPNVLNMIDKQTGYRASVEVINPTRNNLVRDYYDGKNKVGYIDLEATIQDEMNRRYYYHSTEEKLAVQSTCTRLDLTRYEKIDSVKDWFEPKKIVASSEIFKDLVHLGPTGLMVYANSISDKASFVGSELIEGRNVNHWFYCSDPDGPYIDFYFDVKTSLPYRFSLYYPKWIETQEVISVNETRTVKKQVDSESKYVYNFYMFKPLVIPSKDPIPYPLGYGCARKNTISYSPLPDFSKVEEFTMDMEAVITYSDRDPFKSNARVMKRGDVISYEIKEEDVTVRHIEMALPLGGFEVDEHTGQCSYLKIDYWSDVKLLTRWPLHGDHDFNLLDFLVMKPPKAPSFLGSTHLGPFRVEEYRARDFLGGKLDALVVYYYNQNNSDSVPSKVIFTRDLNNFHYNYHSTLAKVEVTIINYQDSNIDFADSFDVSGCYKEPGSYTWFQLLFSNPSISEFNMQAIKQSTEEYLTTFIPITRIGAIHTQEVGVNIYVTVKLYDRVHFIDVYKQDAPKYTLINPTNIVKTSKVEDCEALCTATEKCDTFSFCSNSDCLIHQSNDGESATLEFRDGCRSHHWYMDKFDVKPLVNKNYVSTMPHVLQQIRNKVSSGDFRLHSRLVAEDLFIVSGPEEIGDISQELHTSGFRPLRAEDFPMIATDRHFKEAQLKIEKSTLQDCFMACLNDDDCNTLSYCVNQNKECILSGETSSSLKDAFEDKTSHADGCNIYQKSFINLFHEYPGKNLVVDAISTEYDVSIADCASKCAQSSSFNCESFDYCGNNKNRSQSLCFLHVHHIVIDETREINVTNWKFAEAGCSHYSKESQLDYEHKVGLALKDNMKESIVGTFEHLSLEHCASRCNSDPDCFTLEYCEMISLDQISDSSVALTSCTLTNLKPNNVNQPQLFEESNSDTKICSIYINHKKITGKSKTDPHKSELLTISTKSNNFALEIGFGAIVFILAFAGGFIGFKFVIRKGFIS
ncbi:uncharacterized protein LOC107359837 [Tetranychus urticae]|uniref:uncharacterized protein LOC107359837 n=1 Tax=Tetranychus urticae TaxID=32264 RepID=UPI00077BAC83|nr:uncharacterized protein LOC107359837 [Tetranychus urticae]